MTATSKPLRTISFGLLMAIVFTLALAACSTDKPLGPPIPEGATILGGPSMTSYPPPPDGWNPQTDTPKSQQQAQDTVIGYLQKTVNALPSGIVFDRGGFIGGNRPCEDDPVPDPTWSFSDVRDVELPAGSDPAAIIQQAGDIWRSWGWYVFEHDGFPKPNQFGYGPDGYTLQIESRRTPGQPPTITGASPCFPDGLARNDIPRPAILKAT